MCEKCKIQGPVPHCSPEEMTSITSPWPFVQWGLDIMGLMPWGKGDRKFILVAVVYFTKLVEVESFEMITATSVTRFLWKVVVCQYGIPRVIITNNGRQFNSDHYRSWCDELGIMAMYSSPRHPYANGQVEATNKTLVRILEKRLVTKKGVQTKELPGVLWAYCTMV